MLAAVGPLVRPSPPEAIAAAVDAMRRSGGGARDDVERAPCASVEEVRALLHELEQEVLVKAHSAQVWASLGVSAQGAEEHTRLWWPVHKWREAVVTTGRRDLTNWKREEAQREEDRARRESRLRNDVEAVLEANRRMEQEWRRHSPG
ncbi:hypothetical protein [Streptomyces sp. NPDC091268]|uniref:hypothetical protein n=1 Tax=Streptomyces sp. NPDC091268 TaxID=3365979 RepID=UPI003803EA18